MLNRFLSVLAAIAVAIALVPTVAAAAPFDQECNDRGECWTVSVRGDQE